MLFRTWGKNCNNILQCRRGHGVVVRNHGLGTAHMTSKFSICDAFYLALFSFLLRYSFEINQHFYLNASTHFLRLKNFDLLDHVCHILFQQKIELCNTWGSDYIFISI